MVAANNRYDQAYIVALTPSLTLTLTRAHCAHTRAPTSTPTLHVVPLPRPMQVRPGLRHLPHISPTSPHTSPCRYDQAYVEHFTGVRPLYLPTLAGYVTARYRGGGARKRGRPFLLWRSP